MNRLAYRFLLPIVVAALLGLALPMSHVKADPITYTWDFRTDQHGAVLEDYHVDGGCDPSCVPASMVGTYESGQGFLPSYYEDYIESYDGTFLRVTLPNDPLLANVTQMTVLTTMPSFLSRAYKPGVVDFPGSMTVYAQGDHLDGQWYYNFLAESTTSDWRGAKLDYSNLGNFTLYGYAITGIIFEVDCTEDCEPPLGDLTMPLKSADLHPEWGMYDPAYVHGLDEDWPDDEGREPVYAYSDKLFASVHAVVSGTVTAVDNDITSQCETLDQTGTPFAPHACYLVVPAVIAGEAISQLFALQMTNTALVLVKDDEDENTIYTYFVTNPKVAVGDHVEAGCIVGETITLNNSPAHIGDISVGGAVGNDGVAGSVETTVGLNTIQTGESVTVVRRDNLEPEITRLYPELTAEPDESVCSDGFGSCLNGADSTLLSLDGWVYSDSVTPLLGGGASLPGGSQIYQQSNMTLSDASTYVLNIQARSTTTGNGFDVVNRVRLFAGEDSEEFPITTTWLTYSISFLGEDLAPGDAYGVVNRNAADVGIEIRYICVSGEDATQAPNACYFKNHHFDDGPTDWTIDGGVTFQSGQAFTYNDSTLEQSVMLYPLTGGGDATYNLTVAGRLIATNAYTGQSGKYIDLSYRFPMSGDYTLIDEIDSSMVESEGKNVYSGTLDLEHTYVLTVPITISTYTTGLFSIKTNVTDGDNYLLGFRVDYACLQSVSTDDGSFPGQGGAGFDPPFYENCEVVSVPQDNNISSWTYYHWSNLKRFFDCTLMVKLNSMAQLMDSAWKTSRLFFRWIVATGQLSGRWMSTQVFPWLNGQFRNIAFGTVTTVYQDGGGSCSDLFCVLEALINGLLTPLNNIVNSLLGILGQFSNFLFSLLTALLTLIVGFITQLLGFLQLGQQLLGTLVSAYNNASAIPIDGLPTCGIDPRSSPFCMGIWILDNTIFSGTGAAIIPALTAVLSIHILLWVVAEMKRTVMSAGTAA